MIESATAEHKVLGSIPVGGRHLLLRSSDASEGGGGAFAGAPCCRLTLSSFVAAQRGDAQDVAGRSPATEGAGLWAVSSG